MSLQRKTPDSESDSDRIHNFTTRALRQIRNCVEGVNRIVAGGDKAAIEEALDPEVVTAQHALAQLANAHSDSEISSDLEAPPEPEPEPESELEPEPESEPESDPA